VVVWALTSRYPRYMTASYPLLALGAALGWRQLHAWLVVPLRAKLARVAMFAPGAVVPRAAGAALLALMAAVSVQFFVRNAGYVSVTPESREAFLRERIPGYEVLSYLRAHPAGRLYQVALSDAIYYAPNPLWGDMLGPWRYADFIGLPPDQLAKKLLAQGFGTIVFHAGWVPMLDKQPGFDRHFSLMTEKDGVKAYRILQTAP
jgi:hypothetical protein